jgi:hypothetical protein
MRILICFQLLGCIWCSHLYITVDLDQLHAYVIDKKRKRRCIYLILLLYINVVRCGKALSGV